MGLTVFGVGMGQSEASHRHGGGIDRYKYRWGFGGIAQFADYLLIQFAVGCQLRKTTHLETYRGYASVRFGRETLWFNLY